MIMTQREQWLEAIEAPATCGICQDGCYCPGDGSAGCEHFGCWGPDATGTCPGAATERARLDARRSMDRDNAHRDRCMDVR